MAATNLSPVCGNFVLVLMVLCCYCGQYASCDGTHRQQPMADDKSLMCTSATANNYLDALHTCRPEEFNQVTACQDERLELRCPRSSYIAVYTVNWQPSVDERGHSNCRPTADGCGGQQIGCPLQSVSVKCHRLRYCLVVGSEQDLHGPCLPEQPGHRLHIVYVCLSKMSLRDMESGLRRINPCIRKSTTATPTAAAAGSNPTVTRPVLSSNFSDMFDDDDDDDDNDVDDDGDQWLDEYQPLTSPTEMSSPVTATTSSGIEFHVVVHTIASAAERNSPQSSSPTAVVMTTLSSGTELKPGQILRQHDVTDVNKQSTLRLLHDWVWTGQYAAANSDKFLTFSLLGAVVGAVGVLLAVVGRLYQVHRCPPAPSTGPGKHHDEGVRRSDQYCLIPTGSQPVGDPDPDSQLQSPQTSCGGAQMSVGSGHSDDDEDSDGGETITSAEMSLAGRMPVVSSNGRKRNAADKNVASAAIFRDLDHLSSVFSPCDHDGFQQQLSPLDPAATTGHGRRLATPSASPPAYHRGLPPPPKTSPTVRFADEEPGYSCRTLKRPSRDRNHGPDQSVLGNSNHSHLVDDALGCQPVDNAAMRTASPMQSASGSSSTTTLLARYWVPPPNTSCEASKVEIGIEPSIGSAEISCDATRLSTSASPHCRQQLSPSCSEVNAAATTHGRPLSSVTLSTCDVNDVVSHRYATAPSSRKASHPQNSGSNGGIYHQAYQTYATIGGKLLPVGGSGNVSTGCGSDQCRQLHVTQDGYRVPPTATIHRSMCPSTRSYLPQPAAPAGELSPVLMTGNGKVASDVADTIEGAVTSIQATHCPSGGNIGSPALGSHVTADCDVIRQIDTSGGQRQPSTIYSYCI